MADNRFLNPPTMPAPRGYTHVVETAGPARTIYISGQLGMTPDGNFAGAPGDFRAQCVQAFENMSLALKAVGARWSDVVKINNFLVDIQVNMVAFREVRDRYLNTKAPPASTTIGVPALARPGGLFEIEAIAMLPGKAAVSKAAGAKSKKKTSKKKRR